MVVEMLHIVGYHLPSSVVYSVQGEGVQEIFKHKNIEKIQAFDKRLYSRVRDKKHREKEVAVSTMTRDDGENFILDNLTPHDLRILVKTEEELSQSSNFLRIFPTSSTHPYLQLLSSPLSYSDKLL